MTRSSKGLAGHMTPSHHAPRSVLSFHVDVAPGPRSRAHFKRAKIAIGSLAENVTWFCPTRPFPTASAPFTTPDTTHLRDKFTFASPSGGMNDFEDGATIAVGRYRLTMTLATRRRSARAKSPLRHPKRTPADDAMRAVYADCLEENGRASAAHFIRAQLDLATMKHDFGVSRREGRPPRPPGSFLPTGVARSRARRSRTAASVSSPSARSSGRSSRRRSIQISASAAPASETCTTLPR